MLEKLSAADFQPYLNDTFLILLPEMEPWPATLVTITEMDGLRGGYTREETTIHAFSLVFRSEETTRYLGQNTYTIEHPQMGQLPIFLVPIGPDPRADHQGIRYEAVFG